MLLSDILPRTTALFSNRTAVVCGDCRLSYGELGERVARLTATLVEMGVGPGDRVAILHRNCHRMMETYFAAVHAGAVLVPLNHRLTARDLAYIIDDTSSRVLLADEGWAALVEQAVAAAQSPPNLLWCEQEYEAAIGRSAASGHGDPAGDEHDPANIYYTSGTTGHQKGVVLTHRNISSHALATIAELGLTETDVWAHVAPMFHLADAWATWAITMVGGRHVFVGSFEPRAVLQTFVGQRVTVTNLIPTMLNDLVAEPAARSTDFPDLRLLMSGGAPISPQLVRRIVETFRCEYVQTYGLTETSPYLTFSLLSDELRSRPPDEQMRLRSRTGRPALGVQLRVVDEHGEEVPADDETVGEIVARGDRITPGYWRLPEATAEAFRGGWFHTGDLATVDREGYLNIVDRAKDVILTGGEIVYSTEVENALYEHSAVSEVAVVGVPDERLGERVHAVVVAAPGHTVVSEELIEHCRGRIAHYKCPRSVATVAALPRTGSGKISKKTIRESLKS
jgi:acyl-CoA synthetase (AMP-forming)/AMP-acid ligase II